MSNKGVISGTQSTIDFIRYAQYVEGSTALVAQGGGQCGIFTSGVLDAFILSNFDPFDSFYGTSAGALNICAYLCRQNGLGRSFLVDLTTSPEFFNLFGYIRQKQSMDIDWALDRISSYPYKVDLDLGRKILGSRGAFACVTEVSHIHDEYLPILGEAWYDTMRATCAIPGLYDGEVTIGDKNYIDGGVTAAIPVQEAWRQGSRNIVVIRTDMVQDLENPQEAEEPVEWLREPLSLMQDRWSQTLVKWKEEWSGFWQDRIDKSREKKITHKHLDLLNGGRWLFGADDVYRLSHLLGDKFDSGLADYLMVHYQTFALTQQFMLNPPDDCFVIQIAPSEPLKSSALLSKKEDLLYDYQLGLEAGYSFIKAHAKSRKLKNKQA
ncbi:patatin-like phospholipase family protein [Vibrio sp. SCSIO 43137]|uniref:patatin-like phospholipase family protein n=1 Tax=Vibrio sp. SCSIO 43137 TaxID=3021011 RepID=UPI0023075621|nr:patatin-like phospholipase family protein [Vibrio sp. SCSIO 43137]WCE30647.1 DUF6363 domain-containing protein [Vibrio sp. SCSIO 43137]